ncbi:hypothetical protein BDL97_12G066400 [Sphagnum fallax]|nr:hypothetical protein BDL97_12G066400 [Sphagnum fallax]
MMLARSAPRVAVQEAQIGGGGEEEKGAGGVMKKYHSLSRRELQALCKEYHVPANKSNLAMAQALAALHNTAAPAPGTKLLTVGRPSTVTLIEGARRLKKPLEKKQSSRISFVSRSVDQGAVRRSSEGAAGAKKLPAQSCKKFIPAIAVMNGSASCRQTFDQTVQTDSSSIQAATRQMVMPTRKAQALKLRPKELVNGSHERTMMHTREQPCIELLPSISPIEKGKMGRTKPVVKRELGNKEGAVAVKKIDAMYKPSGKENIFLATNVKTLAEKSSLRNEENYLIQKCLQLEETRRNMNFNNCVKTAAKETSAAAAPTATLKPLSSDCDSCAAIAPHDGASNIAPGWENATAEKESFPVMMMVERSVSAQSFSCAYENQQEEVLKDGTCHNKKVPSSVPVSAAAIELESEAKEEAIVSVAAAKTTPKGTVRSFCLESEELSNKEACSSGFKESDAGFISVLPYLSPLNIQSVKSENSSTLSTQRSVIDYILLPPWSPPKTSVVAEQSMCHRRHHCSKSLTTNQKTGGRARNCGENRSAAAEQSLRKNDYLMRSLLKLRTSIRDKVMRKDKVGKL